MKLWITLLLVASFASATGLAADPPKAVEKKQISGEWSVVSAIFEGETAPADAIKDMRVVFTDDTVAFKPALDLKIVQDTVDFKVTKRSVVFKRIGNEEGKYKLDPTITPTGIVFSPDAKDPRMILKGIVALDGDRLKLNVGYVSRPKDFSSELNSRALSFVLKR